MWLCCHYITSFCPLPKPSLLIAANQSITVSLAILFCGQSRKRTRWHYRLRYKTSMLELEIYCDDHSSLSSITAVQIWIISYKSSHHFTSREDMNSINWPRSQLWPHSSVGRASHRYRGGHGFESRWSPDFVQASSFQLLELEIYCHDHFHFHNECLPNFQTL